MFSISIFLFSFKLFNLPSFSLTEYFKALDLKIKLFISSVGFLFCFKRILVYRFFREVMASCNFFMFLLTSSLLSFSQLFQIAVFLKNDLSGHWGSACGVAGHDWHFRSGMNFMRLQFMKHHVVNKFALCY